MKRILLLVATVALMGVLLVPGIGVAAQSEDDVSQLEAVAAALYYKELHSGQFPKWRDARLGGLVVVYSDVNNKKSAYEFSVESYGKNVGYIMISATKDNGPMLECGGGKSPSSYLGQAKEVAIERGYIDRRYSGEPRLLYWCGLSYSIQFGEQMKDKGIAIHLPTGTIQQVPTEVALQVDKDRARAAWADILEKVVPLTTTVKVSGVPAWYQSQYAWGAGDEGNNEQASYPSCKGPDDDPWAHWDGCSPIAGSMVHGYWNTHGYPNFPNPNPASNDDILPDDNHYYMGTTDGGYTWWFSIDNGIASVCTLYGYGNDFDVNNDILVSWNDIKGQVDAGNPAVLSIVGGTSPYSGGHSTTVVGYTENGSRIVIIHDTWDDDEHNLTFGNWSAAQLTKIEET